MPVSILAKQTESKNAKLTINNCIANNGNIRLKNSEGVDKRKQYYNQLGELIAKRNVKNYLGSLIGSFKINNLIIENRAKNIKNSLSNNKIQYQLNSLSCNFVFIEKQQEGMKRNVKNVIMLGKDYITTKTAIGINKRAIQRTTLALNKNANNKQSLAYVIDFNVLYDIKAGNYAHNTIKNAIVEGVGYKANNIRNGYISITASRYANEIAEGAYSKNTIRGAIVEGVGYKANNIRNGYIDRVEYEYKNDIKDGKYKHNTIRDAIDAYEEKKQTIRNVINEKGIYKDNKIKNAIESYGYTMQQSIRILLDNKDITGIVKNGNISVINNGVYSYGEVELATDKIINGHILKIEIQGKEYRLMVEENEFDIADNTQKIWGRPETAILYQPYSLKKDYAFINKTAKEIANSVVDAGYTIDWQIDDWLIDKYEKNNAYPMEVIKDIAKAGGGVVRCTPDNVILIKYPYIETNAVNIQIPLSIKYSKQVKESDGVKVIFKDASAVDLTSDKNVLKPGEWATVRVYCKGNYIFKANADVFYKNKTKVKETIEESVECEKGKATLSKPVLEIIDNGCAQEIKGQDVICDECQNTTIKYKTIYDEWKLTNNTEARVPSPFRVNHNLAKFIIS